MYHYSAQTRICRQLFSCISLFAFGIVLLVSGCSESSSSDGAGADTSSSTASGSDSSPLSTDSGFAGTDSATDTAADTETASDTIPDTSVWEDAPGQPCVMYVNSVTGADTDDGRSWKNARQTIQSAIDVATGGGCTFWEVWVAKGTYFPYAPNDRYDATLQLKKDVDVLGGFLGYETQRTQRNPTVNETIISGNIGFADRTDDNACHVVTGNIQMDKYYSPSMDDGSIDGFTIRDGNAIGCSNSNGGGVLNAIVRNCIIADNLAVNGGGAYESVVENSLIKGNLVEENGAGAAQTLATDVVFVGNTASMYGGGANGGEALRCAFRSNTALSGGGTYSTQVNDCRFENNMAAEKGGGAYSGYIRTSQFVSNTAQQGGGIWNGNVWDCYFEANSAQDGGGMYDGHSEDSIFVGNTASVSGGGVSGTETLFATFISNTAPSGGGAFQSMVKRAVLLGNSANQGGAVYGGTVTNCTFLENQAQTAGASVFNGEEVTNSIFEPGTVVGEFTFCTEVAAPASLFAGYPHSQGQWAQATFDAERFQTTLVTAQPGWIAGHLAGQFVKLQGTAAAWRGIVSNTADSIVVQGDVTALTAVGSSFAIYDLYPKDGSPIIDAGTGTAKVGSDRAGTSIVDIYAVANTGEGPPWVDQGAFEYDDGERFVDFSFPEREVNCTSDAIKIASDAINALYANPVYTGCSETGTARAESSECVFRDSHFTRAFAPVHYCNPSNARISVRRDMDEAAFWQAALDTMGNVYCDDANSCTGSGDDQTPRCAVVSLPWCVEGQCSYDDVCACGDGTFASKNLWCNGTEDCANGGDEADCQ